MDLNKLGSMSDEEFNTLLASYKPIRSAALAPQFTLPADKEEPGLVSSALKKGYATLGTTIGGLGKFLGAEEGGQNIVDYWKKKNEEYEKARPTMTSKDITGVGSAGKYIAENALQMAPLALSTIPLAAGGAIAGAATGIGAVVGGGLGAALGSIGTEAGIISSDIDKGTPLDRTQILKGAIPAGLLETIPELVGLKVTGLGKTALDSIRKKYGKGIASAIETTAKQEGWGKTIGKTAAGLLGTGLVEGSTESAQSPLEAYGAGKPVFKEGNIFEQAPIKNTIGALTGGIVGGENYTPEMQSEMFESGLAGAAGGIGMTAAGKVVNKVIGHSPTSLTDSPTQEEVPPPQYGTTGTEAYTWTEADIPNQNDPQVRAALESHLEEQRAQALYESTPAGLQEKEDRERQEWRNNLVDSTGGIYEGKKGIDGYYKRLVQDLDSPDRIESLIRSGTETEESIANKQRQKEWIESDPIFREKVPTLKKQLDTQLKEQQKMEEEHNKNQEELQKLKDKEEDANAKRKEAETVEEKAKALQDYVDAKEAREKHEANIVANFKENVASGAITDPYGALATEPGVITPTYATDNFKKYGEVQGRQPAELHAFNVFQRENPTIKYSLTDMVFNTDTNGKVIATPSLELGEQKSISKEEEEATVTKSTTEQQVEKNIKQKAAEKKANSISKREPRRKQSLEKVTTTKELEAIKEPLKDEVGETLASTTFDNRPSERDRRTSNPNFSVEDADALVHTLLGQHAKVEYVDDTNLRVRRKDGTIVDVPAQFINDTIIVATRSGKLYENIKHEAIHAAKSLGLFTKPEWTILETKAKKWIKDYNIKELYYDLTPEQQIEEAIAKAFENRPTENKLFDKLRDFFEKMMNFFKERGFTSADTIFNAFETGVLATRSPQIVNNVYTTLANIPNTPSNLLTNDEIETHVTSFLEAFGKQSENTPLSKMPSTSIDMMHKIYNDIQQLKKLPKLVLFQDILRKAADIDNYEVGIIPLHFDDNTTTISFDKLKTLPKELRLATLIKDLDKHKMLDKSRVFFLWKKYDKLLNAEAASNKFKFDAKIDLKTNMYSAEDTANISQKKKEDYFNKMSEFTQWQALKKQLVNGVYYNTTEDSYHNLLTQIHEGKNAGYDWDLDNKLFAFLHTGITDFHAIPELFLPPDTKSEMHRTGYTDNITKQIVEGYKKRLGLDIDNAGMVGKTYKNLVFDSKLIKDIIDIAKPGREGTFIKLSDYKNSSDRNVAAMDVVNWLAKIGALKFYDYESVGSERFVNDELKKNIDRFEKERQTVLNALAGEDYSKTKDELGAEGGINLSLHRDTSAGDMFIAVNPDFASLYSVLGDSALTADQIIAEIQGKLNKGEVSKKSLFVLQKLINQKDRQNVFNLIKETKDNQDLFSKLVTLSYEKMKEVNQLDDKSTLDRAFIDSIGKTAQEIETAREAQTNLESRLTEVRKINGYTMPLPFSSALLINTDYAYKLFKGKLSHGRIATLTNKKDARSYTEAGQGLLMRAMAGVMLHKLQFGITFGKMGLYDNLLLSGIDFFKYNGEVESKVNYSMVWDKNKNLSQEKFDALRPVIIRKINEALGLVTPYGLPNTSPENRSLILKLEQSSAVQSDMQSRHKSIEELMDTLTASTDDVAYEEIMDNLRSSMEVTKEEEEEEGAAVEDQSDVTKDDVEEIELQDIDKKAAVYQMDKAKYASKLKALATFKRILEHRNKKQTKQSAKNTEGIIGNRALSNDVENSQEFRDAIDKVENVDDIFKIKAEFQAKFAERYYKQLIFSVDELARTLVTATESEKEELGVDISRLSNLLGISYKSKDIEVPRDIRVNIGHIFERFYEWSDVQKKQITQLLIPLVGSQIYANSRKLRGLADIRGELLKDHNGNIIEAPLQLQICPDEKGQYLVVNVADDVVKLTEDQYKKDQKEGITRLAYMPSWEEELDKTSDYHRRLQNLIGMYETENEKVAVTEHEKAEQAKRVKAIERARAELAKGRILTEEEQSRTVIKHLVESVAKEETENTKLSLEHLLQIELRPFLSQEVLDAKFKEISSTKGTKALWAKFFDEIVARVQEKWYAQEFGEAHVFPRLDVISTTSLQNKFDLTFAYFMKATETMGEQLKDVAVDMQEEAKLIIGKEVPVGTIYRENAVRGSRVEIIPNPKNLPSDKFVSFRSIDDKGKTLNTRFVGRKFFEERFTLVPKQELEQQKLDTRRYNVDMHNKVNAAVKAFSDKKLVENVLEFLTRYSNTTHTRDTLIKSLFNKEQYGDDIAGMLIARKELNEKVTDILMYLNLSGLALKREIDGKMQYGATKDLTNYYSNITLGTKAQANIDLERASLYAKEKFGNPTKILEAIKNYPKQTHFEVFRFIKDLFVLPWHEAQGFKELENIMLTGQGQHDKRQSWLGTFTGEFAKSAPIKKVFEKLQRVKKDNINLHNAIHTLVIEGDKLSKEYTTYDQAKQVSPQLTLEGFNAYRELRDVVNKTLRDVIFDAGAHMYTTWATTRFNNYLQGNDHLFSDKIKQLIPNNGRDIYSKDEVRNITQQMLNLIPDVVAREDSRKEMQRVVKGYISWQNNKRKLLSEVKGWMPRVRFIKDYVGAVKTADGKYTHFKYFDTLGKAQAYVNEVKGTNLERIAEATDSNMRSLFSSLDQLNGLENLDKVGEFLENGMSNDLNSPSFGMSVLDENQAGGKHLIRRTDKLVLGYEDTDYLENYLTAFNRFANSFSRLQYGLEQRENLRAARIASLENPALRKLLPKFTEHLKDDLGPNAKFSKLAKEVKDIAVFTYMGFRILPAVINCTQPWMVGVPILAKELSNTNGESYASNLANATSLMKNGLASAFLDLKTNVLNKETSVIGKLLAKSLGSALAESRVSLEGKGLTKAEEEALRAFNKYSVANQSSGFATSILNDYKEDMIIKRQGVIANGFNNILNESMVFMRLTEQLNRSASYLAAYRAFSKNSSTFNEEASRKAVGFVNNSQFMMNSMNMPLSIKQMGPLGRTAMTLCTYPLNFLNTLYKLSGNKEGVYAVVTILAASLMLGGSGALPFKDILAWFMRTVLHKDLDMSIRTTFKDAGSPDWMTNIFQRGLPTVAGIDVANNVSMATPYAGGFFNDKSTIESVTGAAGGILKRWYEAAALSSEGKLKEAVLEKLAPEFIASGVRAQRQYEEGIRSASGLPRLYKGQPLKYEMEDVIMSALFTLKTSRMGEIQEKRESMRKLEATYKKMATHALDEARHTGSLEEIQRFNRAIVLNKLTGLIKPLRLTQPKREPSGRIAFESNY